MPTETQVLNNYISILEKTNQQLSLWSNPYGLMVGILTLLIAVIAIAVSYALWRYSKEQRDKINHFFAEQEKVIKEKNENVKKVENKLNDLIREYEKQLKDTTKNKKEIQKNIDELKKERARIGVYMGPVIATGMPGTISTISQPLTPLAFSGYSSIEKSIICIRCGKNFSYYDGNGIFKNSDILYAPYGTTLKDENVYCPSCGAKNIPQ